MAVRTKRIHVRMSDEMETRASAVAESMGLNLATMMAVAVGDYVTSKERLERAVEKELKAEVKKRAA